MTFLDDAMSRTTALAQKQLWINLRRYRDPEVTFSDAGVSVFSQDDEDGKILYLLARRTRRVPDLFVDIGAGDCVHFSNCSNLAIHHGWYGLFVDAEAKYIEFGQEFYTHNVLTWLTPPAFCVETVTPDNVNQVIEKAGFSGNIGLLSIDVDGADYWIWKALSVVQPAVVVIECRTCWGLVNAVVPYGANQETGGYYGASLPAMCELAGRKGYELAGVSRSGINAFFFDPGMVDAEEVTDRNVLGFSFPKPRGPRGHPFYTLEGMRFEEG